MIQAQANQFLSMEFKPSRHEQLTEKQIKWGYWWVSHKLQLKVLLTVVIGIVAAILVVYAIYGFADWFYGSGVIERAQIGQMASAPTGYDIIQKKNAPRMLDIDSPEVLVSGSGSYDIFTTIINPNTDWWMEIEWHFSAGDISMSETRRTTILPNGTQSLVQLGFKSEAQPVGVDLVIDNMFWRRLDKHRVRPDYQTWAGERLNFQIDDVGFKPPAADDRLSVSRATFNVVNLTGYSYWRIGFFVTLWGRSKIVGVNYVTVSELIAGETRPVDASWFTSLPLVTRVEVTPDIDIFDEAIYMPVAQ